MCKNKIISGQLSVAAKILTSAGVKAFSSTVVDQLNEFNPTRSSPIVCQTNHLPWTVLNKALKNIFFPSKHLLLQGLLDSSLAIC
jgi:hypothetical protein